MGEREPSTKPQGDIRNKSTAVHEFIAMTNEKSAFFLLIDYL
jgi:hypothetical protein